MGKFHSKTAEEADDLLSQSMPSSRRAIKPIKSIATTVTSNESKDAIIEKVNIKTEISEKPPAKKPKKAEAKPVKESVNNASIEPKAKIEADDSDPDKISCPICTKLWHKSNLRFVSATSGTRE